MISGQPNIGVWQCPDTGMWQSGCGYIVPVCGKLTSEPVLEGRAAITAKLSGAVDSDGKLTGLAKTYECED